MPRRPARLLLVVIAATLLLAACTADDPEPVETPSAPAEETPEPVEPKADDGASTGASCLEGEWEADVDVVGQNALSAPGLDAFGAEVSVSGASITTLDGSVMTTVYDDQQIELSWAIEGQEFRSITRYDGTLSGTYSATESELTVSEVDTAGLTFSSTTVVNGEELDLPGIGDVVDSGFATGGTSAYTCTSEELRLQPLVDDLDTSGFVSVLHRR